MLCGFRCRDKQRKEASRLQSVNRKLSAMNKLLMEENDRLQKQVSQLVCENGYMKQQLTTVVCNLTFPFVKCVLKESFVTPISSTCSLSYKVTDLLF